MNYLELRTAVHDWLDHADSDDMIPTFIELARAKINRELKVREMTCVSHATGDGIKVDFDLPPDWAGARQVSVGQCDLEYLTPEMFTDRQNVSGGALGYYTIRANKIRFHAAPGDGTDIELVYYRKVPKLVEDTDTCWLLEAHPDCWLYGAVAEGHKYTMDDGRAQYWDQMLAGVMQHINSHDWDARWSGGTMRIRAV
jgi:hypothetical protein